MKRFFLVAATAISLAACNQTVQDDGAADAKSDTTSKAMSAEDKEERNKKTALASINGINDHNVDAALKDATPDAIDYSDGSMAPIKSVDSIKPGLKAYLESFPDYKAENIKAVADGDWVYVSADWSGTFKKDFMGIKATNKSFKVKDVERFKFNDDGKITEHYATVPNRWVMDQVGAKVPNN